MSTEFSVDDLEIAGDLRSGRPTLGNTMRVSVFRLIFYSLRSVMEARFGADESGELLYQAGLLAGKTLAKNIVSGQDTQEQFIAKIEGLFRNSKIAVFGVNRMEPEKNTFVFSVAEDLECSGLPNDGQKKCQFDAGFISGLLSSYYNCEFTTRETDCWGTGEKVCSFKSMRK